MDPRRNLNRLAYFIATVEEGTITAAAGRLGISKAVVSKQLQQLEQDIGVALVLRNTRHMQPTDAGLAFYAKGKAALEQANAAFDAVAERDRVPKGRLRITAPVDYGVTLIAPFVARYRELYADVEVDLFLTDQQLDIIEERYDLAFRVGWLKDSSNLARKIQNFEEIAVCTPGALRQFPVERPEDLADFPFIANHALAGTRKWAFHRDGETRKVEMQAALSMNITMAIRAAIMNGACFTIMPDFLAAKDVAAGRLVRLVPDWSLRTGGVFTVTPPGRLRSNALRAFLELAQREMHKSG